MCVCVCVCVCVCAANEQNIGFKVHRGFKLESLHVFASLTNKQGVTFLDWVLERMRMNDPRDVEEVRDD